MPPKASDARCFIRVKPRFGYVLFYAAISIILWKVFSRAMIEVPEGIYTGVLNNFGDLPFHLSVITSFAYGNNFPPEDPTYAGVRFTYPFLTDFVSAIFVRCGADLRQSMFIENFILAVSFVGLLHRWALEMVRDRLAAVITPLLVFLNGGFGWVLLWEQAKQYDQRSLGDAHGYSQLSYDHSQHNLALGQRDIHAAGSAARHAARVTDRGHSIYSMVGGLTNDTETGRRGDTEEERNGD